MQSAARGDDLAILITPVDTCENNASIDLKAEMLYGRPGTIRRQKDRIVCQLPQKTITIYMHTAIGKGVANLSARPLAFSSIENMKITDIQNWIAREEERYNAAKSHYGKFGETWSAIQNALNWLLIYDPQKHRAITPVSRPWSYGWGVKRQVVMFCFAGIIFLSPICIPSAAKRLLLMKRFRCVGKSMISALCPIIHP